MTADADVLDVAILGAGFSGLAMAIELDRAGLRRFAVLEAGDSVGGTWRDNTYPGAACDVPSHLYSLSRLPNPGWSRVYATQPEILAYMHQVVTDAGLGDRIRAGCPVHQARWEGDRWRLRTGQGEVVARHLVSGIGALRDPAWPKLAGLDRFRGALLHSARWPEDPALQGARVGVIGTGASAVQLVPGLVGQVAHQTVFQRTPPWIRPRRDRAFSALRRDAYRAVPALARLHRGLIWARLEATYAVVFGPLHRHTAFLDRHVAREIRAQVDDPELARKLTPSYRIGCKRVLLSDAWYPTLQRDDVHLETRPIEAVEAHGVVLAGGERVGLDALICCTGFQVRDPLGPLQVFGRGGLSLRDRWGSRPTAYLGISVPSFPNLYLLLGPNTALGHSSVLIQIEAAARYATQAILHAERVGPIEVQQAAHDAFVREVDAAHAGRVWASGCASWYLDGDAQNFTTWPGSTASYLWRTRRFEPGRYRSSTT